MSDSRAPLASESLFIVGWEEWLALPDLGLPAIRAKIDTGAKTSALHAFGIEPFGTQAQPMVRFGIHPIPGGEEITRYCTAAVVDRREITSSNGEKEIRFVIRTRMVLGGRDWGEIELSLTNREGMAYRMLLGRQAIRSGMLVDPRASFLQPKLSKRLYRALPQQTLPTRHLRIALIATKPARASNLLLQAQAHKRGHKLDILALDALAIDYRDPNARVIWKGNSLAPFDAIIARATGGPSGKTAALVRLMQQQGAVALNGGDALDRLRNPFAVSTALHAHRLPPLMKAPAVTRCLVVQGKVVAAIGPGGGKISRFAPRAAAALDLGLAAIDIAAADDTMSVAGVDPNPSFNGFGKSNGIARAVIQALETRIRTPVRVGDVAETPA